MNGYFVHPKAICESERIGENTRIWAFAHVLPNAVVGSDCNICDGVFIENDVIVGNRVTVKCGVQLWDGLEIEDDVFIGPNATFANDKFPRSKVYPDRFAKTIIRKGASIGANATILPGVVIGQKAMVGAGAVVTRSVPPNAIVIGNPAKITGYVDAKSGGVGKKKDIEPSTHEVIQTNVSGVALYSLRAVTDMRGSLTAGEFDRDLPFKPLRYFLVYDVPTAETRGEHAHLNCHQFLVAIKGSVRVVADDGTSREEFFLDSNTRGLYLPPMTWGIQYHYSPEAVLLVFASHYYDADDYVRDYEKFLELVSLRG